MLEVAGAQAERGRGPQRPSCVRGYFATTPLCSVTGQACPCPHPVWCWLGADYGKRSGDEGAAVARPALL